MRYTLALDLKDDPQAISEYESYHRAVWPEVLDSLRDSGIKEMRIYRTGNRLFMIMETIPGFSFEDKAAADALNSRVREWEDLMERFQQRLPWAEPGQKWVLMEEIFQFPLNS